jgi:hypothetical protein
MLTVQEPAKSELYCAQCGLELAVSQEFVEPCERCCQTQYQQGFNAGRESLKEELRFL